MLLSVIVHIYNNQKALNDQAVLWNKWVLSDQVELIFIDDCSFPPLDITCLPLSTKIFRILDDIPWNMPGAKNLGAMHAKGKWLFFYDADQFIDANGLAMLVERLKNVSTTNVLYRFNRVKLGNGESLSSHQNCQVLRKTEYEKFGGMDEDFSGAYGYDDSYFERAWSIQGGKIQILEGPLIFDDENLSTKNLNRDTKRNYFLRRSKIRYWHLHNNKVGRLLLKSKLIFNFFIACKLISDGGPQPRIRFAWESIIRT